MITTFDRHGREWYLENGHWISQYTTETYRETEFAYYYPEAQLAGGRYQTQHYPVESTSYDGGHSHTEKRSSISHNSFRKPKSKQDYQQYSDQGIDLNTR